MFHYKVALIARFIGPTWGPSGADRTQLGPMLAPWTLLSGCLTIGKELYNISNQQIDGSHQKLQSSFEKESFNLHHNEALLCKYLLGVCEGNPLNTGSPHKGHVMRSFDVSFSLAWIWCWQKYSPVANDLGALALMWRHWKWCGKNGIVCFL